MARDEFPASVKDILAKRVGFRCSNPACGAFTSGPHTDSERFVNIGVASHVTAAAPGGPRYDPGLLPERRASIDNAVWLCQSCAKLADNDDPRFTVTTLMDWKAGAERRALQALNGEPVSDYFPQPPAALHAPIPRMYGLSYDLARTNLIDAGWHPRMNHWTCASNFDMQYGNGLYFWSKGYHEIMHASGIGLAHCAFAFQDVYGTRLTVVTAGEANEDIDASSRVCHWYFPQHDEDDA